MKRFITKLTLLMIPFLLSSAMLFAQMQLTGPGAKEYSNNQDVTRILYEQMDIGASGWASQDFEAAYDVYDCQGADDFTVPAGTIWQVDEVTVIGSGAPGPFNVANVYFYQDAGGLPAAAPYLSFMGLTAVDNAGSMTIAIPGGAVLTGGDYWVSVQDAAPFGVNGQWFWTRNLTQTNNMAYWQNPANGFGTGATTWTDVLTAFGEAADFTFSLVGESYVEIGNGTGYGSYPAYYSTWCNYWENCHTQTLYLASELGGPMDITELGWNFERLATPNNWLLNVQVNIVETSVSAFTAGAYFDMTGATQVFSSANYIPATALGWNKLDINDFIYSGVNNLVIEIIWGDNGYYESPYYRTYKTNGSVNRTLLGYADSETPPNYDAATTWYDDLRVFFKPSLAPGNLEGYVFNGDGLTIAGAVVGIEGVGLTTTSPAGFYELLDVPTGEYEAYAFKDGYNVVTEDVLIISGQTTMQDFILTQPDWSFSPTRHEYTLNPNEFFTANQGILNTGDGPVDWSSEIVYPPTDVIIGDPEPRTAMPDPQTDYSPTVTTVQINNPTRDTWDQQFGFMTQDNSGEAGAESDGVYFYTSKWNAGSGVFFKYELDGNFLGSFNVSGGAMDVRDMAYVDSEGLFYGSNAGTTVWAMDFDAGVTDHTISAATATRAIAYDVDEDGFYGNNWSTDITLYDRSTGAFINSFSTGGLASMYGMAYDNWSDGGPYVWALDQGGSGCVFYQFEVATGTQTGFTFDVVAATGQSASAGGAFTHPGLVPGLVTIGGIMQNLYYFGFELAEGGASIGSWLSCDYYEGTVPPLGGINNIPTHFNAAGTASGEVYTAELIFTSDPDIGTVTIECTMNILGDPLTPPTNLEVMLTDPITGLVTLTWDWFGDAFQYFVVKRDGMIVGSTTMTTFTDYLPDYGEYCYTVQAQYDEGLTAPAGPECVLWPNPTIYIDPMFLEAWVWVDHTTQVYTTIYNTGIGVLAYEFPDYLKDAFDCEHEVVLTDDFGDGWNGGFIDLYLDGTLTLAGLTIASGAGPESYFFIAEAGQEITTTYTPGGWPYENEYHIFDGEGNEIGADGVGGATPTGIGPGQCYAFCPVPSYIVTVDPASGVLDEGGNELITITYDATGFAPGDYPEDLQVNSNDPDNPEVYIANMMHVYTPAQFAGTVTDGNTAQPIVGVTVTAGPFQAVTDGSGEYSLFVDETAYDVYFNVLGYQQEVVYDTFALAGVITPIDMVMFEVPYPVPWVTATVNDDDTECLVEWALPMGPYEIIYDDGSAEELVVWATGLNENAVKFTPLGYPANITGGRLFIGDGTFPAANWFGSDFAMLVYDDDGANGMPGTVLDSVQVFVNNYGWLEFWTNGTATITDGDFYLSMMQFYPAPNTAPLGVDFDTPTYYRSYSKMAGLEWMSSVYQDFMIRAYVDGPTTSDEEVTEGATIYPPKLPADAEGTYFFTQNSLRPSGIPGVEKTGIYKNLAEASRDVVSYDVARISDFDPDMGPETGTMTTITNTTELSYNDIAWGGLAEGWYAYAVKAYYTNGDESEWVYSNTVGHLLDVEITFEVSLSTGAVPVDVEITMEGETYPNATYFGLTDTNGILIFPEVWKGQYDINAYKIGFDTYYIMDYMAIADDYIIIILGEKRYPPRNLWVDPLTSWAYWEWPIIDAAYEDFEGTDWPPAGWQSLSDGEGWILSTGYSGAWVVPTWDSQFAMSNDDGAPSGNNGSADYLVTPGLDLRESEDFFLMFDSFYDGAYGQLATVEYSYDAGATWEVLYAVPPTPGAWADVEIDLTDYCGAGSAYPIWFAFHSDDVGAWASGWAIDNVEVANGEANPIDFYVFLDGAFVGSSGITEYQYMWLTYGVTYEASVAARYTSGLSEKIYYTFVSEYLVPPRNLDGETFDDAVHLWWEPPLEPEAMFELVSVVPRTERPNQYSDYSPTIRTVKVTGNSSTRDIWDIQYNFPTFDNSGEAGTESDGEYLYTTKWNAGNGTMFQYDFEGNYIGSFIVSGAMDVRDLAYNESTGYMYGSNAGNTCWEMDFVTGSTVSSISAPTACRAIAYDDGADGFWANNWDTPITLFDYSGATLNTMNVGAFGSLYGLAYDPWTDGGPYLWAFSQAGAGAELVQYDIATGQEIFNLNVIPLVGGTQIAGGLYTACNLIVPGTALVGGILQNEKVFGLELAECSGLPGPGGFVVPENLLGYNVYRDMENIAYVPYYGEDTANYYDLGLEPLTYQYDVTALYDLGRYGFPGDTGESMYEGPFIISVEYGYPLPFQEYWISGGFEVNQWTPGDNWTVNGQIGNPEPASEFTWDPVLTDYRSALSSFPLDGIGLVGDPYIDGCIWFEYDVKLDDRNMTGAESLTIEVGNENGWHTLATYDNADGSFDWTHSIFDITEWAFGQIFRVRFVAEGASSADILSWFVDNIEVYKVCEAPVELMADVQAGSDIEVHLSWTSPYACTAGGPGGGEWIFWDDGVMTGGIGLTGGGVFSVASHWDPDMLTAYDGMAITTIRFVPYANAVNTVINIKVWEGTNASTLLIDQALTGYIAGEWNEVELAYPVYIDVTKELWFGYTCDSPDGENPAGHDAGPAIAGYGDMITLDGATWDPISSFGAQFDINWNLQAWVTVPTETSAAPMPMVDYTIYNTPDAAINQVVGENITPAPAYESRELQGYNVYKDGEFLDFTADTFYVDYIPYGGNFPFTVLYDVTAVYEDCESLSDTVTVLITGIEDNELAGNIAVYPNPARDVLNVKSSDNITHITMMNNVGQLVFNKKVADDNVLEINVENYEPGLYMIKIETADDIVIEKVLITR